MTDREARNEGQQLLNRPLLLMAVDGHYASDGPPARHDGKALSLRNLAQEFRKVLVGLAGADCSVHDRNLVDNTNYRNQGCLYASREIGRASGRESVCQTV